MMPKPKKRTTDPSNDIIAVMRVIADTLDTKIPNKDFDWYYRAAHNHTLSKVVSGIYDVILNSASYSRRVSPESFGETDALQAVNKVVDDRGMATEEIEYMWTLADVDNWIYHTLKTYDLAQST